MHEGITIYTNPSWTIKNTHHPNTNLPLIFHKFYSLLVTFQRTSAYPCIFLFIIKCFYMKKNIYKGLKCPPKLNIIYVFYCTNICFCYEYVVYPFQPFFNFLQRMAYIKAVFLSENIEHRLKQRKYFHQTLILQD